MPISTSTAAVGGVALETILLCPECGHAAAETMPTDAWVFLHECVRCAARLRPRPGDCCVFCSYGCVPCPPVQLAACGCRE